MKIIYLHQYFNTPTMSGGTRSYEMARRLVAAGHEVEMVTTWREPKPIKKWFETTEAGIRVHWLPIYYSNRMTYRERIRAFLRFAIEATRKATSLDGDVVFATSTPLTIAIPGVLSARKIGVPLVFEVRDLWPELPIAVGAIRNPFVKWVARQLELFAYRNSTSIIALSPGMRDGVVSAGFPADKVFVIPNSADLTSFRHNMSDRQLWRRQLGVSESEVLVAYAGTLGKINGVGYLVHVAKELLRNPEFKFVVVGDGQEREQIIDLAKALGVMDRNFFYYSAVPKQEIARFMSAVDVATSLFLPIPEMEANSANKFFDALASGTPIAINYGGWQADLLKESGAGIVLPPDDPRSAALQLNEFVQDATRLNRAKQAALELAQSRFDRDILARRLETVLVDASSQFCRRN